MGARSRTEMGGMVLLSKALEPSHRPPEEAPADHHEISPSEPVCKPMRAIIGRVSSRARPHARLVQFGTGPTALKRTGCATGTVPAAPHRASEPRFPR